MRAQHPKMRAVVVVMKPHRKGGILSRTPGDLTVDRLRRELGGQLIRDWPPPPLLGRRPPPFYVLWPRHAMDPAIDRPRHAAIFRRCILDCYAEGDWLIFADETFSLCEELGLSDELITVWTKGGGMGTGIMGATQKSTHVPLWMWSMATHGLLYRDPDRRARMRYGEISGFDGQAIADELKLLRRYHGLYLNQREQSGCVLVPD